MDTPNTINQLCKDELELEDKVINDKGYIGINIINVVLEL